MYLSQETLLPTWQKVICMSEANLMVGNRLIALKKDPGKADVLEQPYG